MASKPVTNDYYAYWSARAVLAAIRVDDLGQHLTRVARKVEAGALSDCKLRHAEDALIRAERKARDLRAKARKAYGYN